MNMKISAVIPTRGDRSLFLNRCNFYLERQTLKVDDIIIVDDKPKSTDKDITYRYKLGIQRALKNNNDVIFFIEDDDWYSKYYIEWMMDNWSLKNKPSLFGIAETYYYNIFNNRCHYMDHPNRASAFCTMLTKDICIKNWPNDNYSFFDLKLWEQIKNKDTIKFKDSINAIGIKHGLGIVGGGGHSSSFRFNTNYGTEWLINNINDDYLFYQNFKR